MRFGALLVALFAFAAFAFAQDEEGTSVGMPRWIRDLVLPGTELEAKPSDVETSVVVRIADVRPHGDSFRYDIEYYGLDVGSYDLAEYLQRKDGTSTEGLPEIPVEVVSVLPEGQVVPNRPQPSSLPRLGGYSILMWLSGIVWIAGLWAILTMGRKKPEDESAHGVEARPLTLAERLRPLVEQAVEGELSRASRADLELALIAFWRKKLALGEIGAAQALTQLKQHDEAGPLLRQMEEWLHRPDPPQDVDIGALLEPYKNVPADALESAGRPA